MEFVHRLRRLLRHATFRRLFAIRLIGQTADGVVQVGMMAYALFSPQKQPSAWAVVAVLAITLVPFSLVGPFVSVILDRFSRQRITLVTDTCRAVCCLGISSLIWFGNSGAGATAGIYVLLLVVLSLNRFLLAGLAAGMGETVDEDEYLDASSLMPMIGPAGLMVGGGIAAAIRLVLEIWIPTSATDSLIFCTAAVMFCCSIAVTLGMPKFALGPGQQTERKTVAMIWTDLVAAIRFLHGRRPVLQGFGAITAQRISYGMLTVTTILAYRNLFHTADEVNLAIADMGSWFLVAGIGFVLSGVVCPPIAKRLGMRRAMILFLVAGCVFQVVPGSIFARPALVAAGFGLGLTFQSGKVCVDTLVQAHVPDEYRGRAFVVYDVLYNMTLFLGSVIAALVAPVTGLSLPVYLAIAALLGVAGLVFALRSRELGDATFNAGTQLALANR
jgi:MFS family permease